MNPESSNCNLTFLIPSALCHDWYWQHCVRSSLVQTGGSDWSRVITWPGYWPLIGAGRACQPRSVPCPGQFISIYNIVILDTLHYYKTINRSITPGVMQLWRINYQPDTEIHAHEDTSSKSGVIYIYWVRVSNDVLNIAAMSKTLK